MLKSCNHATHVTDSGRSRVLSTSDFADLSRHSNVCRYEQSNCDEYGHGGGRSSCSSEAISPEQLYGPITEAKWSRKWPEAIMRGLGNKDQDIECNLTQKTQGKIWKEDGGGIALRIHPRYFYSIPLRARRTDPTISVSRFNPSLRHIYHAIASFIISRRRIPSMQCGHPLTQSTRIKKIQVTSSFREAIEESIATLPSS
jgi:hypothetical protein